MNLLSILSKYKKEDAVQMEKEQYKGQLSAEEIHLLDKIKDEPKPFDSMLNPSWFGQTITIEK